jgi:ribosomal protein S8
MIVSASEPCGLTHGRCVGEYLIFKSSYIQLLNCMLMSTKLLTSLAVTKTTSLTWNTLNLIQKHSTILNYSKIDKDKYSKVYISINITNDRKNVIKVVKPTKKSKIK